MYLFFDTETTGLPKNYKAPYHLTANWPRMVQLGYALIDNERQVITTRNIIIKPVGFTIPVEASDIHRITTERALEEGVDLAEALAEFLADVKRADTLVGHNVEFDMNIVGAELVRSKVDEQPLFNKRRICLMKSSTDYCQIPGKYGYKWPSLSELHIKLFGRDFDESHDAFEDVKATANCFFRLKTKGLI